ncbi:MAG: hypothetical protein GQ546_03365 [Gammaproteobacteria bacterium]|nr:hypothetical protein [Gammaproteobacteria bacterium]
MPHERNEEMQAHLDAWKTSGLTQVEYCQQNNIKSHIFTYYKSKLGYGQAKVASNTLMPVQIVSEQSHRSGITISLPDNNLSIDINPGFDPQTLQQVLTLLK